MKISSKFFALLLAIPLGVVGSATAADFTPKMSFGLAPAKVKANPELHMLIEQDEGEEELGAVTSQDPRRLQAALTTQLSTTERRSVLRTSRSEPAPVAQRRDHPRPRRHFPDRPIVEQDRTDEQADRGVKAVWVVDLRPVTSIPLEVKGSVRRGWTLTGEIPANQFTCPPLVFDGTIHAQTEDGGTPPAGGGVKILTNPAKAGKYTFSGTFGSQDSPTKVTIKQTIKITK